MKKSIILYILAGIIIIFSVIKIVKRKEQSRAMMTVTTMPVIPAEGYLVHDTVVTYDINTIGSLRANEAVDIESEISKRLVSIQFTEGTYVKQNDILFKLDDADLQAKLAKLLVEEKLAKDNEQRSKALLESGGLSQQEYDETLNALETLEAEINIVQVDLDKTEIRAPFAGKVGMRYVSEGAYITPSKVLTRLEDTHRIRLDFAVPERYAGSIKDQQEVTFTIPGNPRLFKAIIAAIQPGIDPDTRDLQVMAYASNDEGLLIPGTSAKVSLTFTEAQEGIFVPSQCLIPSLKGYDVYAVRQGKAVMTWVKTGIRTNDMVQILEGTEAGDTLLVTNLLRVKQGSPVQIVKFD
jgi:membrane fusion protein (multidrug efflux system)